MRLASTIVAAFCLLAAGCEKPVPARSQWLLVISTDALVPQFGDQLLVEVLAPDGTPCTECQREFDASTSDKWPVSFGIEPPPKGDSLRVRARLFRSGLQGPNGLTSDRIIDGLASLPSPSGVQEVDVALSMQCFGLPADVASDRTCDPATGAMVDVSSLRPMALKVGTWGPGASSPCSSDPPPGMACIPGGAFLMGDPIYVPAGDLDPVPEQLVAVSSFFLDKDEVTVGQMRKLASAGDLPLVGSGSPTACTFTSDPAQSDALPVNCISFDQASSFCNSQGKRLPSEAEWEWAAGNLGRETPYPWTDGGDPCGNAIVSLQPRDPGTQSNSSCEPSVGGDTPGLRAGGNPLDVTTTGVVNLAGNVAEWVADSFSPYASTTCWGPAPTLRTNPVCKLAGADAVARGGSWSSPVTQARVTTRAELAPSNQTPDVGFRCAQ